LLDRYLYVLIDPDTRPFFLGKLRASKTTARNSPASVATAVFALSNALQTPTEMKPNNSANGMPNTGNSPGDTALNARAH
jgi:hypothetical protein